MPGAPSQNFIWIGKFDCNTLKLTLKRALSEKGDVLIPRSLMISEDEYYIMYGGNYFKLNYDNLVNPTPDLNTKYFQ